MTTSRCYCLLPLLLFSISLLVLPTYSETWIFGYGSLISKASRDSTYPTDKWRPVRIDGIKRGWFAPGTVIQGWASFINNREQLAPTYLGAYLESGYSTNGVIFTVDDKGLAAFDKRELSGAGYTRETISLSAVTPLDSGLSLPAGDVVYFYNMPKSAAASPTRPTPIVTSYVDVIMTGCLSIDTAIFGTEHNFSIEFIKNTTDWSEYWVNDRLLPRRPWVYQPLASTIDKLLVQNLGSGFLSSIELDDPTARDDNYGDRLTKLEQLMTDVQKFIQNSQSSHSTQHSNHYRSTGRNSRTNSRSKRVKF